MFGTDGVRGVAGTELTIELAMKLGQAGAKLKHYTISYTNIGVTPLGNNKYKVSSLRQPSGESYKLKTYMIVQKQSNGKWLIKEEMMQTKVQTFLKYAK